MNVPEPWASAGRWFDRDWYLLRNPDVARTGIEPLAHYLRYGEAEGRPPCAWFDPPWYRLAYGIPPGASPLAHFLVHRTGGEFLPCAALYSVPLTAPWRDGPDPFDRYLDAVFIPGREVLPDLPAVAASGLVDAAYHRLNGCDPFQAELDPALHYCRFGWHLGMRPNDAFDPAWYETANRVAMHRRINPLAHYILEGEAAGRRPVPWFDPVWYRGQYGVPEGQSALAHYLAHRGAGVVSPNAFFDPAWYVARLDRPIPEGIDPFAHYLVIGAVEDVEPSPHFEARLWRHRHMAPLGAPGQAHVPVAERNPLVHFLART